MPPAVLSPDQKQKKKVISTFESTETRKAAKQKGKEAFFQGKYDEAIESYTEAINLDPNDPNLLGLRSTAFTKVDKYDDALMDTENMIKLRPADFKGHLLKANTLYYLGRYDECIIAYQEVKKVFLEAKCSERLKIRNPRRPSSSRWNPRWRKSMSTEEEHRSLVLKPI